MFISVNIRFFSLKIGPVDHSLIDSCNYLMESVHDFRLRFQSYTRHSRSGKSKTIIIESTLIPKNATIFVTNKYSSWQIFVINELKQLYLSNNHSLPDNEQLSAHFKGRPEIDKNYQKKLMPFVIRSKDILIKTGDIKSLDQYFSFDEYQVLHSNREYLQRALNIESIKIRSVDDIDYDTTSFSHLEDIMPCEPVIYFHDSS